MIDVIVIGGGVVGCAIARELTRYQCKVVVLEKNLDVAYETSGRNSAVVHGGFSYEPNTLKAKFCVEANQEFDELSKELDFPFKRCGKVLVGNTEEDYTSLQKTLKNGQNNGVKGLSIIDKTELKSICPEAVGEFALYSKNSGILDPFLFTVALAENAVSNGAEVLFDHEVLNIVRKDDVFHITTNHGNFQTRWVVNSAGLNCGKISEMVGIHGYNIVGSKGDYIVLDKRLGELLPMPIYPVPSTTYMGIHVTNTIDGNVTVGPNAENVSNFDYYGVSSDNIQNLAESARRIWPHIHPKDYIRNYSGILSKWIDENGVIQDFTIETRKDVPCFVNLIGIESPGLTCAMPIAREVVSRIMLKENYSENSSFDGRRKGIVKFSELSEKEQELLIKDNPDYGEVICRCEKVTKAELLQAIYNPLHVHTMVGIKYRTRCMMGRCQGGYCQMRMAQMIQDELKIAPEDVRYNYLDSHPFVGRMRKNENNQ